MSYADGKAQHEAQMGRVLKALGVQPISLADQLAGKTPARYEDVQDPAPLVTPEFLAHIERQIAAIDFAPWRADFEDGDLIIWFHANLTRDPRRIIVSDGAPSANERAAAEFLVYSREYCQALIRRIRELEAGAS